jgi:metal-responsive CopG/Arc/MetJ family transcriptional regulator
MLVTRKPVLVQLDDDLVDRLDAYAAAHQTNRSAVLREAASVLLDAEDRRADLAEADRQLVESYTRVPQEPELVEWAQAAQDRALADTPNEWTAFEPPQGSAGGSGGC